MFWLLVEDTWLSTLLLQLQQMPRLFRGEVEAVADQPTPFDRVSGAAPGRRAWAPGPGLASLFGHPPTTCLSFSG